MSKAEIIAQLRRDILPLEGYRPVVGNDSFDAGLGFIKHAFPNATFPVATIHEFICEGAEDVSASSGFITGILAAIMKKKGVSIWITSSPTIFPPALKAFGVDPEKIIFLHLRKEKEILWAAEEALKCKGLCAVIAEIQELSFTASRRFQLAVEQSRVTGFIIRNHCKNLATTSIARWKITSLKTQAIASIPGVGFPHWQVELMKVRNGTIGTWQLEWTGRFKHVAAPIIKVHNAISKSA